MRLRITIGNLTQARDIVRSLLQLKPADADPLDRFQVSSLSQHWHPRNGNEIDTGGVFYAKDPDATHLGRLRLARSADGAEPGVYGRWE